MLLSVDPALYKLGRHPPTNIGSYHHLILSKSNHISVVSFRPLPAEVTQTLLKKVQVVHLCNATVRLQQGCESTQPRLEPIYPTHRYEEDVRTT